MRYSLSLTIQWRIHKSVIIAKIVVNENHGAIIYHDTFERIQSEFKRREELGAFVNKAINTSSSIDIVGTDTYSIPAIALSESESLRIYIWDNNFRPLCLPYQK